MKINVLSCFDGMSCGQISLNKIGIGYNKYYASEIKKHAIEVTAKNYPDTIQLGDVTKIDITKLETIDLLIGGSPCQSFSNSNQWLKDGENGFDGKSKLFFEYVRILNDIKKINPDVKFLLENVRMKKEWKDVISKFVEIQPIEINSSVFSAQNRPRLYWTNIAVKPLPAASKSVLRDIIEASPDAKYTLSEKAMAYMSRLRNGKPRWEYHKNLLNEKSACLTANMFKGIPYGVIRELNRRLTPLECERLQTVPDSYTDNVSDTSRYNLLGDGWTVDVIAHIFSSL
jgi:site-specific DNA-cytosine methylase